MEGIGLYTGILTSTGPHVDGLDDFSFPLTQGTQETYNDLPSEAEVDVVEVQASEVSGRRRVGKGVSHRSKKFDPKEDIVICSAWLNVSKDPINGANQTRLSFWKRIHDFFEKNKTTSAVRSESSIMHRWLTIQKDVNKYCACYEAIERRNQSGSTIEDMISEASEMYVGVDEDKKSFTLLHCWRRLKDEDKWKSKMIELAEQQKLATNKKQKTSKEATPRNVQGNNDDLQEIAAPASEEWKRPMGQKKAKESRRGSDDACIVALDKIWDKKEVSDREREKERKERYMAAIEVDKAALEVQKASLELEKKRLANEEKKVEADLLKEEKEIMLADMSSLDATQLQWLEIMKKKIIARHTAN